MPLGVHCCDESCQDSTNKCNEAHSKDSPIRQLGQADAAKKPNIFWIVGENFFLDLAYYGQKNVSTPNFTGSSDTTHRVALKRLQAVMDT